MGFAAQALLKACERFGGGKARVDSRVEWEQGGMEMPHGPGHEDGNGALGGRVEGGSGGSEISRYGRRADVCKTAISVGSTEVGNGGNGTSIGGVPGDGEAS